MRQSILHANGPGKKKQDHFHSPWWGKENDFYKTPRLLSSQGHSAMLSVSNPGFPRKSLPLITGPGR